MRPTTILAAFALVFAAQGASANLVYDPATDFAAGWAAATNPNGVWSYGWSSTLAGPITLFTERVAGADSPNQIFWVDPNVNCCIASPSVGFNNGPAFNDGNVGLAANQIDMVASVNQNLVTDLIFTAPAAGAYSVASSFVGAQYGIGVGVDVLFNGASLFSSTISAYGQTAPFDTILSLTQGDQLIFAVSQNGGNQNTGLNLQIASVPSPIVGAGFPALFGVLGYLSWRRRRMAST